MFCARRDAARRRLLKRDIYAAANSDTLSRCCAPAMHYTRGTTFYARRAQRVVECVFRGRH